MPVRWREWALGVTPACDEDVMASGLATVWGHRPWGPRPAGADGHIHGAHLILPCPRMPSPAPRDPLCLGHRVLGLLVALKPYGCTLQGGPGLSRLLYWVLTPPLGASPWVGGRVWVGSQEAALPPGCPKGFYGKHCRKKCHCASRGRCHRLYGACLCDPGLYGRFCHLGESH